MGGESGGGSGYDLGSLLSGIGSIMGGFGAMSGGAKYDGGAADHQYFLQRNWATNYPLFARQAGEKAGINPLYLLGSGGQSFRASPVLRDNGTGEAMARMGQGLAQIGRGFKTPEERKLAELAMLQEQAKLDRLGIENDILRKKRDEMGNDPGPGKDVQKKPAAVVPQEGGRQRGQHGASSTFVYEDGTIGPAPSQDFAEASEEYFPAKVKFFLVSHKMALRANAGFRTGNPVYVKEVADRKKMLMKDVEPGYDLRWDYKQGAFYKHRKKHPFDEQLWRYPGERPFRKRSMKHLTRSNIRRRDKAFKDMYQLLY